jgi:D-mannonate dehydratase
LEYSSEEIEATEAYYQSLSPESKQLILDNILKGLPGSEIGFTLEEFREMLKTYAGIDAKRLAEHLRLFLDAITPVAEEVGCYLCIHPDDPPLWIATSRQHRGRCSAHPQSNPKHAQWPYLLHRQLWCKGRQ